MGFEEKGNEVPDTPNTAETVTDDESGDAARVAITINKNESSVTLIQDEDEEESQIESGRQCTLKEQLEKDKKKDLNVFVF